MTRTTRAKAAAENYAPPLQPEVEPSLAEKVLTLAGVYGVPVEQHSTLLQIMRQIPETEVLSGESIKIISEIVTFLCNCDENLK